MKARNVLNQKEAEEKLKIINELIIECIEIGFKKFTNSNFTENSILDKRFLRFTIKQHDNSIDRWSCSIVGILSYLSGDDSVSIKLNKETLIRTKIDGTDFHSIEVDDSLSCSDIVDLDELLLVIKNDEYEII